MATTRDWSTTIKSAAPAIAGLATLMLVTGIFLGAGFSAPHIIEDWFLIMAFRSLNAIINVVLAVLIISRHPRHIVGWLFLIVGFFLSLAQLQSGLVALAHELPIRSESGRALITLVGHMAWVPWLMIPISLVLQFFPDGRQLSRRWRPLTVAVVLAMVGFEAAQALSPWDVEMQSELGARNFWSIPGSEGFFDRLLQLSTILLALGVIGTWTSVWVRVRRSRGIERTQMKWLVYTAGITIALLTVAYAIPKDDPNNQFWYFVIPVLFPLGMGIAILRHNIFDIDIIIQRTLVYGILSVLTVVLYAIIVGGLSMVFQTQANSLSGVVAAGILAMLFQPARDRLQRGVNRLMYGERDDPTAVITQLAQQLETTNTPTAILPNLVHTVSQALKIPHVAIWLPISDEKFDAIASWGDSPDHVEMMALNYQNETIGQLVVAPRSPSESFNHNERQLLNTIAALTALTVRAVQLSDELRRSRRQIVTAREEERRRIRRDLHDGLGPQLASQTLELEVVEQLLHSNPEKAQQLLNSVQAQAQEAILDVRRLVYALRPPALDDLGLIGALRQSVTHLEKRTLRFTFDVPEPLPELPAAVETAVYRIAQEALTNIVHHAQATNGKIHVACDTNHLILEISDDGRGLPPGLTSGVGLQSMRERAAELNGQCVIESRPAGGTIVRARLPLEIYDA